VRGRVVALALALMMHAAAQSGPETSFEVASVRRLASPAMYSISKPGEKIFTVRSASMKLLLCIAFGVNDNQVQSKANWLDNEYYDISAEAEGERGLSREELRRPLQRLLGERFKLEVHRETKDVGGYLLTVRKGGPKLTPGPEAAGMAYIMPNALTGASMPMASFASMLGALLRQPVVDRTGIAGNYAVKLRFAPQGSTDSELPSLFTALEEQMGLKLESHAVPVEFLVVDHIEKIPVEN
jgi:uncharacterized protein (TIGR03435 family)